MATSVERARRNRDAFDIHYRPGLRVRDIADMIGCTERTVARILRERGLSKPDAAPVPLTPEQIDKYRELLDVEGWTYAEIARTFGHSGGTISRHLPGRAMPSPERGALASLARRFNALETGVEVAA